MSSRVLRASLCSRQRVRCTRLVSAVMRISSASVEKLESKRTFLQSILLSSSLAAFVGTPHNPTAFKPAARVAHPYSELEDRKTRNRPTCPVRSERPSSSRVGWRTTRARIRHGGATTEVWVEGRVRIALSGSSSHGSRPLVTGRNLAPINGCRSLECGGEEESRHGF